MENTYNLKTKSTFNYGYQLQTVVMIKGYNVFFVNSNGAKMHLNFGQIDASVNEMFITDIKAN